MSSSRHDLHISEDSVYWEQRHLDVTVRRLTDPVLGPSATRAAGGWRSTAAQLLYALGDLGDLIALGQRRTASRNSEDPARAGLEDSDTRREDLRGQVRYPHSA